MQEEQNNVADVDLHWKDFPAYGDIIADLSRTLAAANKFLVTLMAEQGLTGLVPSHGTILVLLMNASEPVPMARIADAIGKDPSTVTTLVKKLVKAGYVQVDRSSEDKRVMEVSLTQDGRALCPSFRAVSDGLLGVLKENFSEAYLCEVQDKLIQIRLAYTNATSSKNGKEPK